MSKRLNRSNVRKVYRNLDGVGKFGIETSGYGIIAGRVRLVVNSVIGLGDWEANLSTGEWERFRVGSGRKVLELVKRDGSSLGLCVLIKESVGVFYIEDVINGIREYLVYMGIEEVR